MKVSYTMDELNDWYIECQENAEILIYVGEVLRPIHSISMAGKIDQLDSSGHEPPINSIN